MDALYDYIDKLQNNKADKEDINSSMDVKADKHALDSKVNFVVLPSYVNLKNSLNLNYFLESESSKS